MNKIISVHNYSCKTKCQHADVCYFVNSKHKEVDEIEDGQVDKIETVVDKITGEKDIYYSGCDFLPSYVTYGMTIYGHEKEKHMTFSSNHYNHMVNIASSKEDLEKFKKNIQITVYSLDDLKDAKYYSIQKLYLIKDEESFNIATRILMDGGRYNKVHFPIYQKWAEENEDKLLILVGLWNLCNNHSLSLDSCLENYISNGTCGYAEDYIDLRYDGTVRRCPFSDECHEINDKNPDEMFNIPFEPKCIYSKLFGKKINDGENQNGNA